MRFGQIKLPKLSDSQISMNLSGSDLLYNTPSGIPELRCEYRDSFLVKKGFSYPWATDTIVTQGAKHALWLAFELSVFKDTKVLLPKPAWTNYYDWAFERQAIISTYDPFHPEEISTAIKHEEVDVVVLNYPHNPTGHSISNMQLSRIAALADTHGVTIISDEVYSGFGNGETIASHSFKHGRFFIIDSMSKNYASAGLRVGFLTASESNIAKATSLVEKQLTCLPFTTQKISLCLYKDADFHKKVIKFSTLMVDALASMLESYDIEIISSGGIYVWCKNPDKGASIRAGDYQFLGVTGKKFHLTDDYLRLCPTTGGTDVFEAIGVLPNELP